MLNSLFFSGSCASMMAINMRTHPRISLDVRLSPRTTIPARTEITDSRLRIRDAIVGFMPFCPMIWSVYPTPLESAPA